MLKIKCDINQQDLKRVDLHLVKSTGICNRLSDNNNSRLHTGNNINTGSFDYYWPTYNKTERVESTAKWTPLERSVWKDIHPGSDV